MGLTGRFTLALAALSVLFAVPAALLLLRSADRLQEQALVRARREIAATTAEMLERGARLPPGVKAQSYTLPGGRTVHAGRAPVPTADGGEVELRFLAVPSPQEGEGPALVLYYPPEDDVHAGRQLLVLVLMVTGGLVLVLILVGAWTSRRLTAPLREMIDRVSSISRGHLGEPIHVRGATGELAQLGRAVDRMVRGLHEGQKVQADLQRRRKEAQVLQEFRNNLQPMRVEPPPGWEVDSLRIQGAGAGGSDFVDTLADGEGRISLLVGAAAAEGAPGALLMAMARASLRSALLAGHGPAEAADLTNSSLNRDLARGLYANAMIVRVDPRNGHVELVSAGHQAPAIRLDAAAGTLRRLQPNGIALGFDAGPVFRSSLEQVELDLAPGDALFLYGPGAEDCVGLQGRRLGEKGVHALAKVALEEGLQAMNERLTAFLGGEAPDCDLVFALVRQRGGGASGGEAS